MTKIPESKKSQIARIKKNIENSFQYFRHNYDRWHDFHKSVFISSLTEQDRSILKQLLKPDLEFNVLESYISRQRGEFSKQIPSIEVCAEDTTKTNPETIRIVEDHIRHLFDVANKDGLEYSVYTDTMAGGFSVIKVYTEYANSSSFNQVFKIERSYDPTMCGFDPLARLPHKGDGRYCFEAFPKTEDEFKEEYPDVSVSEMNFTRSFDSFNWTYSNQREKIILLIDYYEKKKKNATLIELSNGMVLLEKEYEQLKSIYDNQLIIEPLPQIKRKRETELTTIVRYRLIEDKILEYVETDYSFLPLVFVDGNSITCRNKHDGSLQQYTRPYVYNAIGAQRLKNFAGQTLANEIENMRQSTLKIPLEGIPKDPAYLEAYKNPQTMSLYVYNQFKDNNPDVRLDPPTEVQRMPIPQEVVSAFGGMDQTIQAVLGSYDASLGINNNQLSGVAIVEAATQSNAAAMPYIVSIMQALTRVAEIVVDLIPKYYVTPMTIPVLGIDGKRKFVYINQPQGQDIRYETNALNVKVEASVNYNIQKSRALSQIIALMQASPMFSEFINSEGLEILLDNIEIRGIDQLKYRVDSYIQKLEQQKQQQAQQQAQQLELQLQSNPQLINAKTSQQKMVLEAHDADVKNQLKAAELAVELEKAETDKLKAEIQAQQAERDAFVQMDRHQAEKTRAAVDLAIKATEMEHRHKRERNTV